MRTLPIVSVPSAAWANPAATAAAEPPELPPGVKPSRSGLIVRPNHGLSVVAPSAPSSMLSVPVTTAPAARSRATARASSSARREA